MFKETLKHIVDGTDGALGGLVMDREGIAIDMYAKADTDVDINAVGVELGVVLNQAKRAVESLGAGAAEELVVGTDKLVGVVRTLGDGYFLALALAPGGNPGKGRFLMRTAAPKLKAELA